MKRCRQRSSSDIRRGPFKQGPSPSQERSGGFVCGSLEHPAALAFQQTRRAEPRPRRAFGPYLGLFEVLRAASLGSRSQRELRPKATQHECSVAICGNKIRALGTVWPSSDGVFA